MTRQRLLRSVTGTHAAPVTVLQGPAGLGKTVLLDEIAHRTRRTRVTRITSGQELAAYVDRDPAPEPELVTIDGLDHAGADDAMRAAMETALRRHDHLVVATRTPLAVITSAMLLDGSAQLILTEDLLLTWDEVAELAARQRVEIGRAELTELHRVTDGWPAIVDAALRARRPDTLIHDRRLDDLIDRYVRTEILDAMPGHDRSLLTAVAATPQVDAIGLAAILEDWPAPRAEPATVDPIALIDRWAAAGWLVHAAAPSWRLPYPLRQCLRHDLDVMYPGRRAHIVAKAAEVLTTAGRTADALVHLLDSSTNDTIIELLRAGWGTMTNDGRFAELFPAVNALPEDVLVADSSLLTLSAIAALTTQPDIETFSRRLDMAESAAKATSNPRPPVYLYGLKMLRARMFGDIEQARAAETEAMELLAAMTDEQRIQNSDRLIYLRFQPGVTRLAEGDLAAADTVLRAARTAARGHAAHWYQTTAETLLAYTSFLRGDLTAARIQADAALSLARSRRWADYQFTDHIHLTLGLIELEYGRTAGVMEMLRTAEDRLARDGEPPAGRLAMAWSTLGMLRQDTTLSDQALLLSGPEYMTNRLPLNRLLAGVACAQAHLVRDDPKAALRELEDLDDVVVPAGLHVLPGITRARAQLALDDPDAAEQALISGTENADTVPLTLRADLLALRLECALRRGYDVQPLFHELLAVLRRTGTRRPVLLLPTLCAALESGRIEPPASSSFGPFAVEIAALRRANLGDMPTLTERESEVLAALADETTLANIAKSLYVSSNTLKTLSRAVYRKLGVTGRHEAVGVARVLGLLERPVSTG